MLPTPSLASAAPNGRDDFSPDTRDLLAKRAGYICSYPGCRRMTVAGSVDRKSGLTLVGVAAHITAAAKGGPRFDSTMSQEERSSESNGIWTCQTHSKFIDDNPSFCTVDELHRWKRLHEKWVFDRVASGEELQWRGVSRLNFQHIGVFANQVELRLGRHNIAVGPNESGKTTLAQIIAAFSGGPHWQQFNKRFGFLSATDTRPAIGATTSTGAARYAVTLSPQVCTEAPGLAAKKIPRLHIEINGNVAADWPRSLFRTLHFEDQLTRSAGDPASLLDKSLHYFCSVFGMDLELLRDSLRQETFANSPLGFRFRRASKTKVEIQVPDGRDFFLPSEGLSSSELSLAIVDIALRLIESASPTEQWLLILDSGFFGRLDSAAKVSLFTKLTRFQNSALQTLFCLPIDTDADAMRRAALDTWIGSSKIGQITFHSFL